MMFFGREKMSDTFLTAVENFAQAKPEHMFGQIVQMLTTVSKFDADQAVIHYQALDLMKARAGGAGLDAITLINKFMQAIIVRMMDLVGGKFDAHHNMIRARFAAATGKSTLHFM